MICNFRTITKKDLFVAKLTKKPIYFGFIPQWHLKKFIKFCKKYKLITIQEQDGWGKTNYSFYYTTTISRTNFFPLAFIMILLSDILNYQFTPIINCFRTSYQTIHIHENGKKQLLIHNKKYIIQ